MNDAVGRGDPPIGTPGWVYYRWLPANEQPGAPTLAWDEAGALRAVTQRYPDACFGEWTAVPEGLGQVADEWCQVWADERARHREDLPVAELLRVL